MKKFPFYYQRNRIKGGACCLQMIAKYHGKSFSLQRFFTGTGSVFQRLTLSDLAETATSVGMEVLAVELSFDELQDKAPLPCIVHWQNSSFVVLYKISRRHVLIADPMAGRRKISRALFIKDWASPWKDMGSGIALLLEPTPAFFARKDDPEIRVPRFRRNKIKVKIEQIRRKWIRDKILHTPVSPAPDPAGNSVHAHMLLGKKHVDMTICTCKTFNLAVGTPCRYSFHDDGSLDQTDIDRLLSQFPGSRVIDRHSSDELAAEKLKEYPLCKYVRDNNFMWIKFLDVFLWSVEERVAYMDSDIVFFRRPEQFIRELSDLSGKNLFNRDVPTGRYYTFSPGRIEEIIKGEIVPHINAGLWILDRSIFRLELIEQWLSSEIVKDFLLDYFLDQTLIAALASVAPKRADYFEKGYDIGLEKDVRESVCKHYVGNIRPKYELEGLRFLIKETDFLKKWSAFATRTV